VTILFLVLFMLALGFALGRFYQWVSTDTVRAGLREDPIERAQRTASDIEAMSRRAEEQIRRLAQRPHPGNKH